MADSVAGFDRAPDRYMREGREAVDVMRDRAHYYAQLITRTLKLCGLDVDRDGLANILFAYACETHAYKYRVRDGAKGDPEADAQKLAWWSQMAASALSAYIGADAQDPRSGRDGFVPYQPPPNPMQRVCLLPVDLLPASESEPRT